MIANDNNIKIVIVEDNKFFNNALTRKIKQYAKILSPLYKVDFTINTYVKSEDFIMNMRNDIDIIFTDFYLGDGVNAKYILKRVNLYCDHSVVVVISERNDEHNYNEIKALGADKFIFKDENVLNNVSYYLNRYMNLNYSSRA